MALSRVTQDPTDRPTPFTIGRSSATVQPPPDPESPLVSTDVDVVVPSPLVVVVLDSSSVVVVVSSSVVGGAGRLVVVTRSVVRVVAGASVVGGTVLVVDDVVGDVELVGAGGAARVVAGRLARSTLVGGLLPVTTSKRSMSSERAPRQ
jgi:hypothetical protein